MKRPPVTWSPHVVCFLLLPHSTPRNVQQPSLHIHFTCKKHPARGDPVGGSTLRAIRLNGILVQTAVHLSRLSPWSIQYSLRLNTYQPTFLLHLPRSRSINIVFCVGSLHVLSEALQPLSSPSSAPPAMPARPLALLLRLIFYSYKLSQKSPLPFSYASCLGPTSNYCTSTVNTPQQVAPVQRMIPPLSF